MNKLWHKRCRDHETFDKIDMEVVPRYKTSGLSGDEWRVGVRVRFWFKGEVVHEWRCRDMRVASMLLGKELLEHSSPIPNRVIELEKTKCDQPGCADDAAGRYLIKKEYGHQGEDLAPSSVGFHYYRQFCAKHARRGDCGREDADRNYEPMDTLAPERSTNTEEAPSMFGGVIVIDGPDGSSGSGEANA